MNGELPFRAMVRTCNRKDPRWPAWKKAKFDKTSKNPKTKNDRSRYRRNTRRERKILTALDFSAPLALPITPKSRRLGRWIYRKILPIIFRRLFDARDRFIWDAVEHKYYQYLKMSTFILNREPIDRLAQCYPWRSDRIHKYRLKSGILQSSDEPTITDP
jgi:hypothetical protein